MCKEVSPGLLYECDGNCGASGGIWGTYTYTGDSNVYLAAKHCGLVPGRFVKISKGSQPSYYGSTKNGVTTNNYGPFATSYVLVREGDQQHSSVVAVEALKDLINHELDKFKQSLVAAADDSKLVCSMCMSLPRTHLCMPCNHFHYCPECIKIVIAKGTCVICQQEVTGHMKAYI